MYDLQPSQPQYLGTPYPVGPTPNQDPSREEIDFRTIMSMIRARKKLIAVIMTLCVGLAAGLSFVMHKKWQASAQLVLVQRDPRLVTPEQIQSYEVPDTESIETQLGLIQSPAMAQRIIDRLKNDAVKRGQPTSSITYDPDDIQRFVVVTNPKDTEILNVAATANSPDEALQLADATCEAFVDLKKEMAQHDVASAVEALQGKVAQLHAQADDASKLLNAFKQAHHVTDIDLQQRSLLEQIVTQTAAMNAAKQDAASSAAQVQLLSSRLSDQDKSIAKSQTVRDDTVVQGLQTQLTQLELQRAEAGLKYRPKYPGVLGPLDAQIATLRKQISAAIQGTASGAAVSLQTQGQTLDEYHKAQEAQVFAEAKFAAASQAVDELHTEMTQLSGLTQKLQSLTDQNTLASKTYNDTLSALISARLAKDRIAGNVQIAQNATVPVLPFRPSLPLNLAIGLVLGILISAITMFISEQSDRRVRSINDVYRIAHVPVIGTIPSFAPGKLDTVRAVRDMPMLTDMYNIAYANLMFTLKTMKRPDGAPGTILLVTSSVPGEGKSVTSAHLAAAIAASGKKVVLVDADLRRPTQDRLFESGRVPGLAEVLSGIMSLDDAVLDAGIPNLHLLHAGHANENSIGLILKPRMLQVLDALRSNADLVVVDTPACSVVGDALFLADYADCILQIVGIDKIDEDALTRSVTTLDATSKKRVVMVTHAPETRQSKYYREYYSSSTAGTQGHSSNGKSANH
jgi:capsular exopolysaccharide synthesis family protein